MRILVTGSTGFVGAQLCRRLCAAGHKVRAFHRPESSLAALAGLDKIEHILGDITQPDTITPALNGIDVVFHTAAKLGKNRHQASQYEITVLGTRHVAQAALDAGVQRLVHTSSVAALGVPKDVPLGAEPIPMDETHTWNFPPNRWPYGHAKYLAELEIQQAVAKGLDAVIVNPSVILGPGDINFVSLRVVLQVAQNSLPVAAPGGINIVHIDDVVSGHLAALEKGKTGERYLLTSENLTILAYLQLIARLSGAYTPKIVLPARFLRWLARPAALVENAFDLPIATDALFKAGYYFFYDNQKASQNLGMTGWYSAEAAVQSALDWYQARATHSE